MPGWGTGLTNRGKPFGEITCCLENDEVAHGKRLTTLFASDASVKLEMGRGVSSDLTRAGLQDPGLDENTSCRLHSDSCVEAPL